VWEIVPRVCAGATTRTTLFDDGSSSSPKHRTGATRARAQQAGQSAPVTPRRPASKRPAEAEDRAADGPCEAAAAAEASGRGVGRDITEAECPASPVGQRCRAVLVLPLARARVRECGPSATTTAITRSCPVAPPSWTRRPRSSGAARSPRSSPPERWSRSANTTGSTSTRSSTAGTSSRSWRRAASRLLLHGLLDELLDGYFLTVQALGDEIELLEDQLFVVSAKQEDVQRRSYKLRRSLVLLRRTVLAMRKASTRSCTSTCTSTKRWASATGLALPSAGRGGRRVPLSGAPRRGRTATSRCSRRR
jgi:hypothetical protein